MPRVLLGCHAVAWRVAGSLLSLLRFHCGTKGLALCGVLLPSTPLWNVVALLCAAALRYSSLMFRVPHWTSTKARKYPVWSLCALSPPVRCCLPAPCLPSLCGFSCVRVWFCPLCSAPLFLFRLLLLSCACVPLGSSLSLVFRPAFCRALSVLRSAASMLNSFVFLLAPLSYFGPWRFHFLPLPWFCLCVSGLCGLFVLGCVLVGPLSCFVLGWLDRGSRTRFGAMDWTALQRASLALTSGAPCFAVQSAREQQSLHTWFGQY